MPIPVGQCVSGPVRSSAIVEGMRSHPSCTVLPQAFAFSICPARARDSLPCFALPLGHLSSASFPRPWAMVVGWECFGCLCSSFHQSFTFDLQGLFCFYGLPFCIFLTDFRAQNTCIGCSGTRAGFQSVDASALRVLFPCGSAPLGDFLLCKGPCIAYCCDHRAHNTCIGCSGARAGDHSYAQLSFVENVGTHDVAAAFHTAQWMRILLLLSACIVPAAHTFLLLCSLALLKLLFVPVRTKTPRLCTALSWPLAWVPPCLLLPLGAATHGTCLSWKPHPSARRHRRSDKRDRYFASTRRMRPVSLGVLSLLARVMGFGCLPHSVPVPPALLGACWILQIAPVDAMPTTAASATQRNRCPPHELAPSELTDHVGSCDARFLPSEASREQRAAGHIDVRPLPWSDDVVTDVAQDRWIGVYLYTPHYRPVAFAVRMPPEAGVQHALDIAKTCGPGAPAGHFNEIAPLRPQRGSGYLYAIRFPAVLKHIQDGYVAVICDLAHVGGKYFATVLPRTLTHAALVEFLLPLTKDSDAPLRFVIGCRTRVWPEEAMITLRDGDVITGVFGQSVGSYTPQAEDLADRSRWGPMCHFFDVETYPSTCVMYGRQRYSVASYHHQGFTLLTRPLGLKPKFIYTNVPRLHAPSLCANLGIALPEGYELGVIGGSSSGSYIKVDGCCTLLLYARETALASSSSSEEVEEESQASRSTGEDTQEASTADLDIEDRGPNRSMAFHDATIPEAHSWNAASSVIEQHIFVADPTDTWEEAHAPAASPASPPVPVSSAETAPVGDTGSTFAVLDDVPGDAAELSPPGLTSRVAPAISDDEDDYPRIQVLVYVPDVVPELLEVPFPIPCGVDRAIHAIDAARDDIRASAFPRLFPAVPQPDNHMMMFVATPRWYSRSPIVLIDCRRMDYTIFACALPPCMNRESLLVAAGLRHDFPADIFVHGLVHPLHAGQFVALFSGMVLTVVPLGSGAPATSDLSTRLQSRDGWDLEAIPPGPPLILGHSFWLLTDGQSEYLELAPGRRPFFREDAASLLKTQEHKLLLKAVDPPLSDCFFRGQFVTGVVVATEQISGLPFPPARVREHRIAVVLDCRRIVLGIRRLLVHGPFLPISEVTAMFQRNCPFECVVKVSGADTQARGNDVVFVLRHGQVLTVDYCEDMSEMDASPDSPGPPGPPAPSDGDRRGPTPGSGPAPRRDSGSAARDAQTDPPIMRGGRSRSPRSSRSAYLRPADSHEVPCLIPSEGMWFVALLHDALAQSRQHITPALDLVFQTFGEPLASAAPALRASRPFVFGPNADEHAFRELAPILMHRLLQEPVTGSASAQRVVDFAREATLRLGFRWPMAPELRAPPDFMVVDETDAEDNESDLSLVQVVFVLLAPAHVAEHVDLQILVPQDVEPVLDLIDTCRRRDYQQSYPALCPVHPQPDARWGLVLMTPAWPTRTSTICIDMTLVDGRIFAAVVAASTDRFALLLLAGVSAAAELDVYVPGAQTPLDDNEEVSLPTGACVTFVPRDEPPSPGSSLLAMLQTHLGWAPGPAFPLVEEHPRYCFVGDHAQ